MTKHEQPPQTPPPYPGYPVPVMYPPEAPIDWGKYWKILVEQRKLVGAITIVGTLIATATAFLMTPIYRAEALLAPSSQEESQGLRALAGQFGDLAALAGINLGASSKDKTAEYVAALKSRSMSVSFISEQKLLPVLFASKWDADNNRWKDSSNLPTEWKAFELWDEEIRRVIQDRRSGLVTVTVDWKDPVLAAKWANELVLHVNSKLRADAVDEADRSIAFLEKQLPQTNSVEVQQAIYRLIETQTKRKMIASTRAEYAFAVIDPAAKPEKRYRPRRAVFLTIGLILGLTAGVIAALVMASRQRSGSLHR